MAGYADSCQVVMVQVFGTVETMSSDFLFSEQAQRYGFFRG